MTGKNKCKILKEIRCRIAKENDIPFITSLCSFQGNCKGTCPKCEQELVYLEQQLAKRQQLGKMVTVSALALGITLSSVGCVPRVTEGDVPYVSQTDETEEFNDLLGDPTPADTEEAPPIDTEELPEPLEGDVAWSEDETEDPEEYILGMLPATEETDGE